MTDPVITVRISPNERATAPERFDMCVMEATRRGFEVVPDAGAETDLVFFIEDHSLIVGETKEEYHPWRKDLAVELKMPQDLIGSLQNGHLAEQRRGCTYPLRIAVMGSLGDVMRALPTVTGKGWRNPREQLQAEGMILRGIDALQASGVEVDFGISPQDFAFAERRSWGANVGPDAADEAAMAANVSQVMRRAEYILRSKIDLPRARCESAQEAMLRCLPGVGPETARAMLETGIRPRLGFTARFPPGVDIMEVNFEEEELKSLLSVPGIGKKRAAAILNALK